MELKLLKTLAVLGVPGVALGIFYLLLRMFDFQFSAIDPVWSAIVAIVFLVVAGSVTAYALHRWSPKANTDKDVSAEPEVENRDSFEFAVGEETVTFEEKVRSLPMDVVQVNAHSHDVGLAAEYAWLNHYYPGCESELQTLTTLDLITEQGDYDSGQIHFDIISIRLEDGRKKDVYFDISSFFSGHSSSLLDPSGFAARKISEVYLSNSDNET